MQAMTRAQFRDAVRRAFNQIPPIDTGVGAAGVVPVRNPWPTNPNVNMGLDFSVAWASRKARLAGDATPRLIPIPAQTDNGPFAINLQGIAPPLSINDVRRLAWVDSAGDTEVLLTADNRENMDREHQATFSQEPATPTRWWIEAGRLLIWPAPSADGTLSAMFGVSIWSQSQTLDGELLEIIPVDYQPMIVWRTVSYLCGTQPDDAVLRTLMQVADREVADMLPDFLSWAARRSRTYEGCIVPARTRTGQMMGRR